MNLREAITAYLYRLVHDEERGVVATLLLALLRVLSQIYGWAISLRLFLYKKAIFSQHRLPCRVISIGNITVGGTGKTPTAQKLAATIRDQGFKVAILNRGYRSDWKGEVGVVSDGKHIYMTAGEAGDEAYQLAKNLPGIPVLIGKNRILSGQYASEVFKVDVVILDDGYQHWQLARDIDIVLIDALNIFGNNYLLPRGTLREPLQNLDRADAVLLTKVDQSSDAALTTIRSTLARYNDKAIVLESVHSPQGFSEVECWYKDASTAILPPDTLKEVKVLAFSGIGNPSSFEQTLSDLATDMIAAVRYPDHYDYAMSEMQRLMQQAVDVGAQALVTTEKDAVKIPAEFIHSHRPLPVYVLTIEVELTDSAGEFIDYIRQAITDGSIRKQEG
ncbi:tetraacyldisaccharide 4'-kinase [Anaerosporomusa subterranea]|uniref:Tetraacyldisaccharide 4'-kinase n=1 Tax=Anaerosporomusa subterranea TaxID=1794912 RepID=A0A154BR30_ANASB|nr:tetraacyldisaccharide 4'-kinase [Anaerosporomusa subterranea]KYZ76381.1 tetraacyldisaccharide 4'-kinase [Anaerosporomusa subterranea]